MFYRIYCLVIFVGVFNHTNKAQQNIIKNQSAYNLFVLNPAALALNNELSVNCHYKKNWLGITESPESIQLTIEGALSKEQHGLGLSINNEQAGIFSKTYFSGTYRYRIKLNKSQNLYFGLSAGFQKQQSDFSKIKAESPEEFALWPEQQTSTIPDAAFGLVYTHNKLVIMASAGQILKQDYSYKEPVYNSAFSYKTIPQFNFSLQYTFTLGSEVWKYTPLFILRTTQGLPFQLDVVNTLLFKDRFMLGIGYRYLYAAYASLGCIVSDKLRIIYSYEYSLGMQSTTKAGHEIGLRFMFGNLSKKSNQKNVLNVNELEEILIKLDQQDQQIESLTQKVDSLDKNTKEIKLQISKLKNQQIDPAEIKLTVENYVAQSTFILTKKTSEDSSQVKSHKNVTTAGKYKVIITEEKNEQLLKEENEGSKYQIVIGVYQLINYAKDYQKLVERHLKMKTTLIQLAGHPKNYIYVCTTKEYNSLSDALVDLKELRSKIKDQKLELTRGEAWILQTLKN